jgi:Tfp pilus assembly protein FimT
VELMVVVFIMATMLAVAIPSFIRSYNTTQLNATTRSLVSLAQLARLKAALTQEEITLAIDLDRQSLLLLREPGEEDSVGRPTVTYKRIEMPRQVRLQSVEIPDELAVTEGEVRVPFYPNGTCSGVTFLLRGSEVGEALWVVVDPVTSRAKPYEVKR